MGRLVVLQESSLMVRSLLGRWQGSELTKVELKVLLHHGQGDLVKVSAWKGALEKVEKDKIHVGGSHGEGRLVAVPPARDGEKLSHSGVSLQARSLHEQCPKLPL
jgi:hypothetical protein